MNKECGHLATRRRDHLESLQIDSAPREKPVLERNPVLAEMPITRFAPEFFWGGDGGEAMHPHFS